jgi:hypothetical protein
VQLNARFLEIQQSPLGQKIRQRALSGREPLPGDVTELQKQMQAAMSQHPKAQAQIEAKLPGIHRDGSELCLHKSWYCLHFLLTGKSWDPAEPSLGNAISGGSELPPPALEFGDGCRSNKGRDAKDYSKITDRNA